MMFGDNILSKLGKCENFMMLYYPQHQIYENYPFLLMQDNTFLMCLLHLVLSLPLGALLLGIHGPIHSQGTFFFLQHNKDAVKKLQNVE